MSKELQQNQQTVNGPEETSYLAPHVMPKVQSKIQPKVTSKIQAKLLNGAGEKKEQKQQTSGSDKLPEEVQAKMENSFSQDFSNVNIHKDSSSAQDINAKAYTQGSDVHFAPGEYNPSSKEGQELIGHELTHVVQQGQGKVGPGEIHGKGLEINQDASLEKEADEKGKLASEGKSVEVSGVGSGVQRKEEDVKEKEVVKTDDGNTIQQNALSYLTSMESVYNSITMILGNEHRNIDRLFDTKSTSLTDPDFLANVFIEVLDKSAVIAPEEWEIIIGAAALLAKVGKMIYDQKFANGDFNSDVYTLLDLGNYQIKTLTTTIEFIQEEKLKIIKDPSYAESHYPKAKPFAIPEIKLAKVIAKDQIEKNYLALLKMKGVERNVGHTDSLTTDGKYEDTKHYKTALEWHKDTSRNFYLRSTTYKVSKDMYAHGEDVFSKGAGNKTYYWDSCELEGEDSLIEQVFKRMNELGYTKDYLFKDGNFDDDETTFDIGNLD